MNEKGFAPILAILVFLLLAVGVVVAVVVGLDQMVGKENPSESLFNDDAKIKPIIEDLKEKKAALAAKVEQKLTEREQANEARSAQQNVPADTHSEDKLGSIEQRLKP